MKKTSVRNGYKQINFTTKATKKQH